MPQQAIDGFEYGSNLDPVDEGSNPVSSYGSNSVSSNILSEGASPSYIISLGISTNSDSIVFIITV